MKALPSSGKAFAPIRHAIRPVMDAYLAEDGPLSLKYNWSLIVV